MARKQKRKAPKMGSRELKGGKYKPQDPQSRKRDAANAKEGIDRPPKGDDLDVPMPVGCMSMTPGLQMEICNKKVNASADADDGKRKRHDKKSRRGAGGKSRSPPPVAAEEARTVRAPVQQQQPLPKQRPNESQRDYARRVDEWSRQQLQVTNSKMSTEHARARKRASRDAKKSKLVEVQQEMTTDAQDGLYRRAEKTAFGDVNLRPPILSSAAMKSRSKLKAAKDAAGVGGKGSSVGGPVGKDTEIADYADKVREAYAVIKRRRLEGR